MRQPDPLGVTRTTRAHVLSLLTEAESALVNDTEPTRLSEGELYLDLTQPSSGVRRAIATTTVTAHALPKRAVSAESWARILAFLAAPAP